MRATPDGGFAVAASTGTAGVGSDDLWLLRTDSQGMLRGNVTYGGTSFDNATALDITDDGGILLGGFAHLFGTQSDAFLLRLSPVGGTLPGCDIWSRGLPAVWSSALELGVPTIAPADTMVVPADSSALVTPMDTRGIVCHPF